MQTFSTILKRKPRLCIFGKWSLNLNNGGCSIPSTMEHIQWKWWFLSCKSKQDHSWRNNSWLQELQNLKMGTNWAAPSSMPSIKQPSPTSLSFYHLMEYNHHHNTFLCHYYGNSNPGKIKTNQTAICAFFEMTKTICAKEGYCHVPQKQLGYLKYESWTKTTCKM